MHRNSETGSRRSASDRSPSPVPSSSHLASLRAWGWNSFHADAWAELADGTSWAPARVVSLSREIYRLRSPHGEHPARPSGRLRDGGALPAVGDWVAIDGLASDAAAPRDGDRLIHAVLPRATRLSRKQPGRRSEEQVVAANVDVVFLVMGLDGDFNLRRLERFAVMARESGAQPVVILTKSDLARDLGDDPLGRRLDAQGAAPGMPIHVTSAVEDEGLEPLRVYLGRGQTVAMVGSSGAGKSTLLNRLCGEEVMATGAVRDGDDRGRHTTTVRHLVRLPAGGLLIDNPGVREIQLWSDADEGTGRGLDQAFDDLARFAAACHFGDCRHQDEPGCAVVRAVDDGALDPERLESWHRLQRELHHLELRRDAVARKKEKKRFGRICREAQEISRRRKGGF